MFLYSIATCNANTKTFVYGLCILKNGLNSYTNHWSKVYKFLGDSAEWGVQLIWRTIGQEPTSLAVGAGGACFSFFSLLFFLPLSWKWLKIY